MKREYNKPFLAVESFQLDAAIASGCGGDKSRLNNDVNSCTLLDESGPQYPGDFFFGAQCHIDGGIDVVKPDSCYQAMSLSDAYLIS